MIALERLGATLIAAVIDRNFEKLAALAPTFNADGHGVSWLGIGLRFGVQTVTWPGASQTSNAAVVTHGLGDTPVVVLVTPNSLSGTAFAYGIAGLIGTTTFQVQLAAQTMPASPSSTVVAWLAIG